MQFQESSNPVVYGKPGCVQCKYTVRAFENLKVPYTYVDVSTNEIAYQEVKNMGYATLPVVVTKDNQWVGFSPDKIRALKGAVDD